MNLDKITETPRVEYPSSTVKALELSFAGPKTVWDKATEAQCQFLVEHGLVISPEDAPHTQNCDKCLENSEMDTCPLGLKERAMCPQRQGGGVKPPQPYIGTSLDIEVTLNETRLRICPEDIVNEVLNMPRIEELFGILRISDRYFDIQEQQRYFDLMPQIKLKGWRVPNNLMAYFNSLTPLESYKFIKHPELPNITVELIVDWPWVRKIYTIYYKKITPKPGV